MSDNVAAISETEQNAKYYGGTVTVLGRELITSLMAGQTIEFTRIVVGSGEMPEGVEPIDMTDLVEPVAEGVSSVPTVENSVMSMIVEYRNDLNGGLKQGFWLREFGIYAKTAEMDEVLLYYATLGNSPQPVNAYKDNRIDIRRYPVSIALEVDADIEITYNPGAFVTSKEVHELVTREVQTVTTTVIEEAVKKVFEEHNSDPNAHADAIKSATEAAVKTLVKEGTIVDEKTVDQKILNALNSVGSGNASLFSIDIIIPVDAWVLDEAAAENELYPYYADVADESILASQIPSAVWNKSCENTAIACGLSPYVDTEDGYLRFYAAVAPTAEVSGRCDLFTQGDASTGGGTYVLPTATHSTMGGVILGDEFDVDEDGKLIFVGDATVDPEQIATDEAVDEATNDIFNAQGVVNE